MNSTVAVLHFQFANHSLAYRVLGNGPATILAFHGFGQDGGVFESWQQNVETRFTIYAFDLFYHGKSSPIDGELLTKTVWQSLITAFLEAQQINFFSLVGFSLGGRFALVTAEQFISQIQQLVLIAPDGITHTLWYQLATSTPMGRQLFRFVLRHLSALNQLGHALINVGLLHRTVMRFAEVSLATPEQRRLVDQSWTAFRLIKADINYLASLLTHSTVRIRFFTGYFDQIVPGHYIYPLTRQLHSYELTVLKAGHNRLIEQVGPLL